jgi:hypothetical protein
MPVDDREISQILGDRDKHIVGDLHWLPDPSTGHEFTAPVRSATGELIVRGQRCPAAATLRFSLILRGVGRIAALDLGHAHDGAGELHFHRWQPGLRDRIAETPEAPPAPDLAAAWRLFCHLARITHDGHLHDPPPTQETLL